MVNSSAGVLSLLSKPAFSRTPRNFLTSATTSGSVFTYIFLRIISNQFSGVDGFVPVTVG